MVSANAVINKQYGMRNVRESAIFSYIASLSAAQLSEKKKKIWLAGWPARLFTRAALPVNTLPFCETSKVAPFLIENSLP